MMSEELTDRYTMMQASTTIKSLRAKLAEVEKERDYWKKQHDDRIERKREGREYLR